MFTYWWFMHSSISLSLFFSELCISSPVLLSFKRQAYIPCFILNLGLWLASSKWKLHVVTSIIIWVSCRILGDTGQPGTVFKKTDTRQSEILTNFLGIARLISLRTQDICLEISSDCKYGLGLKVEATVEFGHRVDEISMLSTLRKYSSSDTLSQFPMNIHRNY